MDQGGMKPSPEETVRFMSDAYALLHGYDTDQWWEIYRHSAAYQSEVLAEAGARAIAALWFPMRRLLLRLLGIAAPIARSRLRRYR